RPQQPAGRQGRAQPLFRHGARPSGPPREGARGEGTGRRPEGGGGRREEARGTRGGGIGWSSATTGRRHRCVTVHGTLRNESLQASAHTAPLLGIGHCIPGAVARPAAAFALVTLAELFLLAFVLWSNPRRAWRSSSSSHAFRVASPTP
ncbi:unnamed protein product, partial [Prorocentrum cordatum]